MAATVGKGFRARDDEREKGEYPEFGDMSECSVVFKKTVINDVKLC